MSEQRDEQVAFPAPPEGLLTYPTNRVAAQLDDADEACVAIEDLDRAGFDRSKIFALVGPEGAERLDVSGRHHGLHGRVYRFIERLGDERGELERAAEHLNAGGIMLFVPADDDERASGAATILRNHGGHRAVYFGKDHWVELGR
jgi:hypothetical protein